MHSHEYSLESFTALVLPVNLVVDTGCLPCTTGQAREHNENKRFSRHLMAV